MVRKYSMVLSLLAVGFVSLGSLQAQQPYTAVVEEVNKKLVKLFGAGGFKGLPSYGTGILVSSKGHILTVNNHILTTQNLRVHLFDGRSYTARVIAREPELDLALVKVDQEVDFLPYYDIAEIAKKPVAGAGDWILAFSNQFQIATRDEPMSVQRGVIAAYAELRGRRGIFEAPYSGEVYFVDAIANNPGAAGGIITTRKGELLGIIGRELKNTLSDTWINYALPIQAKIDFERDNKTVTVDVATFVKEGLAGTYRQSEKVRREERAGYHGIILVPNAVSATPPFVEEVLPESPAHKAGLRPDDLIVYVDGELTPSIRMLREILKTVGPGTEIKLEVQRGNRMESVRLKLIEQPKNTTP